MRFLFNRNKTTLVAPDKAIVGRPLPSPRDTPSSARLSNRRSPKA